MNTNQLGHKTMMTHADLMDHFKSLGLKPEDCRDPSRFMLTSKLIRCVDGDTMFAAVGSDRSKDEQIHCVVDAVHWYLQTGRETASSLQIVFGLRKKSTDMEEVLNAAAIMIKNLTIPIRVTIAVDLVPCEFSIHSYPDDRNWMAQIKRGERETPPPLALKLSDLVGAPSFRWYRNVTSDFWSGRVEGLQVCTVKTDGKSGILDVGSRGKTGDGKAREIFLKIAKNNVGYFDDSQVETVASVIRELADSRANKELCLFQREHMLESMVLRKALSVISKDGQLEPACGKYPFQFPTLWSKQGSARFVDALMRIGDTPWAIELKEPGGSSVGQDYRHAITQAVLYREYIRRAESMHGWFREKGLDPTQCRSAIAFPRIDDSSPQQWQRCLAQHRTAAEAFSVDVIQIDGFPGAAPNQNSDPNR